MNPGQRISLMVAFISMPVAAAGVALIDSLDGKFDWRFIVTWLAGGWMALGVRGLGAWIERRKSRSFA